MREGREPLVEKSGRLGSAVDNNSASASPSNDYCNSRASVAGLRDIVGTDRDQRREIRDSFLKAKVQEAKLRRLRTARAPHRSVDHFLG